MYVIRISIESDIIAICDRLCIQICEGVESEDAQYCLRGEEFGSMLSRYLLRNSCSKFVTNIHVFCPMNFLAFT